ncbi:MAG: carboxymuconolactone decarboxylase family protein [Steroidobacteraceae bacterium]
MARVKLVFKPSDFPGTPDEGTKKALGELFEHLFPGQENPEIPGKSGGFAAVARDPRLALRLIHLSDYILREMPWTSRRNALKQLMIQTLNVHFKSDYSYQAHMRPAQAAGITLEQQALIPFWRTTNVFNDEQRLVIEYTFAVCAGDVREELFSKVVAQFGEQEALEFSVAVAWWSFWAMIINAIDIEFDFGYDKSPAAHKPS